MPLSRQTWLDRASQNPVVAGGRDVAGQITQGITPGEFRVLRASGPGDDRTQALAEFAARMSDPRMDIHGETLQADTSPALAQELLAPEGMVRPGFVDPGAFGGRFGRLREPRMFEIGNNIVAVDQMTGKANVVYQSPKTTKISEPRISTDVYAEGVDPTTARDFGLTPTRVSGTASSIMPLMGTNAPASLRNWAANFNQAVDAGAAAVAEPVARPEPRVHIGNWISDEAFGAMATNSPPAAPRLRTATNRKTGQKMVFRGGKWQPL